VLRGPQTSAELRLHTERLHRFADVSSVEGFLEELAEKEPAKVIKLPRGPGERENRWVHLLCGETQAMAHAAQTASMASSGGGSSSGSSRVSADELAALKSEQARMAAELAELRTLVMKMASELGL
jgi:uncharacterized protein YceH (UPF0502 family)